MPNTLKFIICIFLCSINISLSADEKISPYKYTDELPKYDIPASSRFTVDRHTPQSPEIIYYLTRPKEKTFPIAILCGGSSDKTNITSIIHFHRYFLKECTDLGLAVLTIEQWGVDGNDLKVEEWVEHYTRSQRLLDHKKVIESLQTNSIEGWNGKFIFIGVSEGGPIVTSLSAEYNDSTIATINWSGAGDWSWREDLWVFLQNLIQENPECPHDIKLSDCKTCFELIGFRNNYDAQMDSILKNPTPNEYFFNMTYKYHADSLTYPKPEYQNLKKPFLVVSGALDTLIESSDLFVKKAKQVATPITYLRIPDMDHYIRKRPDIIESSFAWLKEQIAEQD